ncbi:hypothetical protein TMRH483_00969 [Qipengyuania sp. 483]
MVRKSITPPGRNDVLAAESAERLHLNDPSWAVCGQSAFGECTAKKPTGHSDLSCAQLAFDETL